MKKITILSGILILFSVKVFSQNVPNYLSTNGLVGWYPFTGNTIDSSGNGNNGTDHGATLTTDRFGNPNSAYSFNGSNNYIQIQNSLLPYSPTSFSISLWFGYDSNNKANVFMSDRWTGINYFKYNFQVHGTISDDTLENNNYTNGCNPNLIHSFHSLPNSKWKNVIFIKNFSIDSTLIYLNGKLLSSESGACYYSSNNPTTIGCEGGGTFDGYYTGKLDDIAVYDRVLTTCEISKIYYSLSNFITSNPVKDSVVIGGTATFSISDTGCSGTYQWQQNSGNGWVDLNNAGIYSGVNTKILTLSQVSSLVNNDLYRCIRIGSCGCVDTSGSAKLIVNNTTGIDNLVLSSQIIISPNPSKGIIMIDAPLNIKSIDIENLVGQRIYSGIENNKQISIDISNFASGVYFIRINNNFVRKIVKE